MATYHINPETGETGKCEAKVRECPFQKQGNELGMTTHFPSLKQANVAGENLKEKMYGSFGVIDKDTDSLEGARKLAEDKTVKLTAEELHKLISKNDSAIESSLASRSDLNLQTVQDILSSSTPPLETLCRNKDLPKGGYGALWNHITDARKNMEFLGGFYASRFAGFLVANPSTPPDVLENIIEYKHFTGVTDVDNLFNNPHLDARLLDKIYENAEANHWLRSGDYNIAIAENPKTSTETLRKLATSSMPPINTLLANENLPKDLKKEFTTWLDYNSKAGDMENTTSEELHEIVKANYGLLLKETGEKLPIYDLIRKALRNPNLGEDDFAKALIDLRSTDITEMMQARIMRREHGKALTPKEINASIKYVKDSYDDSKNKAILRTVLNLDLSTEQIKELTEYSLANKTLDWVPGRILHNPNTSPEVLKRMSTNRQIVVKRAIAENANTPKDVLVKYSKMKNSRLLQSLCRNDNLPVEVQLNIARTSNEENLYAVQLGLLEHPGIDTKTLDVLADSRIHGIVEKVKNHPKTSMKTLLRLSSENADEDEE